MKNISIDRYLQFLVRYSALLGILIVWPVFIVGMIHTGLKLSDSRPFSYLGISDFAPYFKAALMCGIILAAVFYSYLSKTFMVTKGFKFLFALGILMQAIVALSPYQVNGKEQALHWTAAIILAFVLILLPLLFSQSQNLSVKTRTLSKGVTFGYLIVLPIEALMMFTLHYYVVSELINLIIFHGWLIYLTFVVPGS